ncbi:MAG TPA: acyl-CoA dehydrogenase family protein [Rhizomicrobium sp.]|jgi:hypothetical protein|nr:acyl-CoA dehydrogenase family protein [Rhizomicrobium sp.]
MKDTLLIESVEKAYAGCTGNLRGDRTILRDFVLLLVPEDKNGYGGRWVDAYEVAKIAGRSESGYALTDDIVFRHIETSDADWPEDRMVEAYTAMRAAMMAGAMEAALTLSVDYVRERKQFGKPLASFQAIQQQLAQFAEETAATSAAALAACHALDQGRASFACAAAKLRANMAVDIVTSVAHQVHGAMGFTKEYKLQALTKKLWAWRSNGGNDRVWADKLGAAIAAQGESGFWATLTEPSALTV